MKYTVLIIGLLINLKVFSQNVTDSSRVDSAKTSPQLEFSGFIDNYYAYSLNKPANRNIPYIFNHSRHNEFNLNLAIIGLKFTSEKSRGAVSLQAGTYVIENYKDEPEIMQHIYEATAGVKLCKKLWLDAGIFTSHIGPESAISKDNWTLTRTQAVDLSPYYETGAKFIYELNPRLNLTVLLLNGWQNMHDNNSNKAVGWQLQYKTKKLLVNSSSFMGEGRNLPDSLKKRRYFHDLFATWQITKKLAANAIFDYGLEEKSNIDKQLLPWAAYALLIRFTFTKKVAAALRAEYFNDANGIIITTGTARNYQTGSYSVNLDFAPDKHVLCRIEGKLFDASDNIFQAGSKVQDKSIILTSSVAISF